MWLRQVRLPLQPSLVPWVIGAQFLQAKIRVTVVPEVHTVAQQTWPIQNAQVYVRLAVSALKALHSNARLLALQDTIV